MTSDVCAHGSLRRSCEICYRDEEIVDLRANLRVAESRVKALDVAGRELAYFTICAIRQVNMDMSGRRGTLCLGTQEDANRALDAARAFEALLKSTATEKEETP